jgi:hypothetical protein
MRSMHPTMGLGSFDPLRLRRSIVLGRKEETIPCQVEGRLRYVSREKGEM